MAFSIRCPACRQKFPWDPTKGFPDSCPNPDCETRIAHDRDDSDVVMPFIRTSARTKAADQVYRDVEAGSIQRQHAASEMLGVPTQDVADLKVTDLKSTRHPGDIAAPELTGSAAALQAHMDAMNARGSQLGFGAGQNGVEWTSGVGVGPDPHAGAKMRTVIQSNHADMVARHAVGVDAVTRRPVVNTSNVVSDAPANETRQPGYIRRG